MNSLSPPLFLTGGSGFLGRAILREASRRGLAVRALRHRVHPPPGDPAAAAASWVEGEIGNPSPWEESLRGCEVVLHAAAAVRGRAEILQRVNEGGTRAVLAAARAAGVRRFVLVSSAVVTDGDTDAYARSKRDAEAVVRRGDLEAVILRPTMVLGPEDTANLPRYLRRLRRFPVYPVAGRFSIQPVLVEDVARAVLDAAASPRAAGHTYDLAGPRPVVFRAFLRALVRAAGLPQRVVLPLPLRPLRLAAPLLDRLTRSRRFLRALDYYSRDHVYDLEPARRDLGFAPHPWEEILETLSPAAVTAAGRCSPPRRPRPSP